MKNCFLDFFKSLILGSIFLNVIIWSAYLIDQYHLKIIEYGIFIFLFIILAWLSGEIARGRR